MDTRTRPSWVTAGAVACVVCLLVASRVLLAPRYLYYFDSVNFALALQDFNPALHQPQPPGYPFFVLLAKFLSLFSTSPQATFIAAGLLGSLVALLLVWLLGRDLIGVRQANWATLLLLFHPPFWFGALTNQVRIFLAVGSAAVMVAGWRSLQEERPRYFYIAAAVLGIASGFRPEMLVFGAPLVVYCGYRGRRSVREWVVATGIIATIVSGWITIVVAASGGVAPYLQLLKEYSEVQFGPTSLAFGAHAGAAIRMFGTAVIWYGLPLLTWMWLTPFAGGAAAALHGRRAFLAVSVLPAFLFHAFIHVGDPDHTLFAVPAIVLIGGSVLAASKRVVAAAFAICLNVILFFVPPPGIARAFSYAAVHSIDSAARETIEAIQELRKAEDDVVLVTYDHKLSWRHFFYYFPETPLIVLHRDPRAGVASASFIHPGPGRLNQSLTSEVMLPPTNKIIWLLSRGRGMHRLLEREVPLKRAGSLAYVDVSASSTPFRFGNYLFTASNAAEVPGKSQ